MTGEPITASEALRIGLVNSVVPEERLMDEASRYAGLFVQRAPFALATAKRLVLKSFDVDLSTGLELERRFIASMAMPAGRKAEQERAAAGQAT